MSSEQFREQGIAAAKARQTDEARRLLMQAVKLNPVDEVAWLYLAGVMSEKKERLLCLQRVLEINPTNELAIKAVRALGVEPEQLLALIKQKRAPQKPAAAPPPPPAPEPEPEPEPYQPPAFTAEPVVVSPFSMPIEAEEEEVDLSASPYDEDEIDINASPYDDIDVNASPYDDDEDDINASPYDNRPFGAPAREEPAFEIDENVFGDIRNQRQAAVEGEAQAPALSDLGLPLPPPVDQSEPGIPLPDMDYLEAVAVYAEQVGQRYAAAKLETANFAPKKRNRAGENEIISLRLRIAGTVAGIIVVLGGIFAVILATSPDAQRIVLNIRTATNTLTPTRTFTPTPGLTDTPTPTIDFTANPTFTPSPTFNLTFTPQGVLNIRTPRPTDVRLYGQIERGVVNALREVDAGRPEVAIPTLDAERQLVSINYNANPYYASALAYAQDGQIERAFEIMTEAETRLEELSGADLAGFTATVNLGFAELHLRRAIQNSGGGADLEAARDRAETALEFDLRYARAHEIIAQSYALQRDYDSAYEAIETARSVDGLADNVGLYIAEALINLQQGRDQAGNTEVARANFERAEYLAGYALFLNPYEEQAHVVRVETALEQDDPSKAVRYNATYRAAYPASPRAFRLLGDARTAEGNLDLALNAYTQAVELGGDTNALVDALLARAELYTIDRRYDLAQVDYSAIFEVRAEPEIRALRMDAAYLAGDFETARADAEALLGTGVRTDDDLRLLQAMILVDSTQPGNEPQFQEARQQLEALNVSESLAGVRNEYLARVYLELGSAEQAVEAISAALDTGDTGTRRFLSAQIQEQLALNLRAALRDYEWVLAWDTVYNFPFGDQARERVAPLQTRVVLTATAEGQLTPTGTVTP